MNRLKNFYLKQKAITLFSLFFFFPFLIFNTPIAWINQYIVIYPFMSAFIFCTLNIMAWYWIIANSFYYKLKQKKQFRLKLFNGILFFISGLIILLPFLAAIVLKNMPSILRSGYNNHIVFGLNIITPIVCTTLIIYIVYQLARLLKMVELDRSVRIQEVTKIFFALLIIPMGIWYVQPKIKQLNQKSDVNDLDLSDHLLDS